MNKRFSKIYVEITNICNLNCSFCSKDKREKKEMSYQEFEEVINKIKDYTDNIYLHVKGEPLLHSHLDKILSICDDNKINVRITTNGTLLPQKCNTLLKHAIKQLNVSLHSENNDKEYFEKVFTACDRLSNSMTIVYRIWTMPNALFTTIVDKINKHYHLSPDVVKKINCNKNTKISEKIYIDKDYEFNWPQTSDKKSFYGTCLGTRSHIAILSDGNVTPCCLDSEGIVTMGNIFTNNLDEIINSKIFQGINTGFQKNRVVCHLCQSCTFRKRFEK